jgi:hypothetical protein
MQLVGVRARVRAYSRLCRLWPDQEPTAFCFCHSRTAAVAAGAGSGGGAGADAGAGAGARAGAEFYLFCFACVCYVARTSLTHARASRLRMPCMHACMGRYSDGSRVLFVGKEPFLCSSPPATVNSYVALNRQASHPEDGTRSLAFEFQGKLDKQLAFKPLKSSAVHTLRTLEVRACVRACARARVCVCGGGGGGWGGPESGL